MLYILHILTAFVLGILSGFLIVAHSEVGDQIVEMSVAVEQCEKDLPRSKHCEPVFSAKIVEEESE